MKLHKINMVVGIMVMVYSLLFLVFKIYNGTSFMLANIVGALATFASGLFIYMHNKASYHKKSDRNEQ